MKTFERVIQPKQDRTELKVLVCQHIDSLPEDKPWIVRVEKLAREYTGLQRRALWGCAYKFVEKRTGYKKERFHKIMCGEFFGWDVDEDSGLTLGPLRTTTRDEDGNRDIISTEVLAKMYDFIQDWVAERSGLQVPDPDPRWKINEVAEAADAV